MRAGTDWVFITQDSVNVTEMSHEGAFQKIKDTWKESKYSDASGFACRFCAAQELPRHVCPEGHSDRAAIAFLRSQIALLYENEVFPDANVSYISFLKLKCLTLESMGRQGLPCLFQGTRKDKLTPTEILERVGLVSWTPDHLNAEKKLWHFVDHNLIARLNLFESLIPYRRAEMPRYQWLHLMLKNCFANLDPQGTCLFFEPKIKLALAELLLKERRRHFQHQIQMQLAITAHPAVGKGLGRLIISFYDGETCDRVGAPQPKPKQIDKHKQASKRKQMS